VPAEISDPQQPSAGPRRRVAVVLAAGQGTRMKSALPKVLHRAGGRALLAWVVDAAREAGCDRILVVVGHGAEQVRQELAAPDVEFVLQAEQRGTGHALAQAGPRIEEAATVLVLSGDVPLVTAATLRQLAEAAESGWGALAVARVEEPGALGRVVAEDGRLVRIVEAKDASEEERRIDTINAGLYAFPAPDVFEYLARVRPDNVQGEIYLTDVPGLAVAQGRPVVLHELADRAEALGVNTRSELAGAHRLLMNRHLERLMAAGVTVLEPARTTLDPGVEVGRDTVIHPDVALHGTTVVGEGCELHQGAWLRDSRLGDGVVVEPYTVLDGAAVGDGGRVGPFARLRPGAELAAGAKAGNFVEIKNARLGEGAKANHLAYVGDAEVGPGANLGAGVVTCNYDGRAKHRTVIGPGAFVGSDTMLVAPVAVGEGASTAAGSVITQDVPPGALGVGRARQRNVEGWRDRRRRSEE
jgi:bifunctional UDP-N-acetylglucosamine pyrophosphorylase / glucosamine-1-phosphate N-acetyltransferase